MLTVLLVEDDDIARRAIERLLRDRGYGVAMPLLPPFGDGAVKLLETETIDAVILDLLLGEGGFDGFDLARKMGTHPKWRSIPIFLSSGLSSEEIQERAMLYAFHGLRTVNVGKPLDTDLLFGALESLAAGR